MTELTNNDGNITIGQTHLSKEVACNNGLSLEARGVYAFIASCGNDNELSIAKIASYGCDNKNIVRKAVIELERNGYLKRTICNRKTGRGVITKYELFDTRQDIDFYEERHKRENKCNNIEIKEN